MNGGLTEQRTHHRYILCLHSLLLGLCSGPQVPDSFALSRLCPPVNTPGRGSNHWGHWRHGHVLHGLPLGVGSLGHKRQGFLWVFVELDAGFAVGFGVLPDD